MEIVEISEKSETLSEYLDGCIDLMNQKYNSDNYQTEIEGILLSMEDKWFTYREKYFINNLIKIYRDTSENYIHFEKVYKFVKEKKRDVLSQFFYSSNIS